MVAGCYQGIGKRHRGFPLFSIKDAKIVILPRYLYFHGSIGNLAEGHDNDLHEF